MVTSLCQSAASALEVTRGGNVREVEVKYHVRDVEALLVALKAQQVELSSPMRQDDQAYAREAVQAELIGLVASLGLEAERTHETYDSLIRAARSDPARSSNAFHSRFSGSAAS
jgi:hypothetical protein